MENKVLEAELNRYKQQIVDSGQELKYNRSGLYEIKVNGHQLYIGKSRNMLHRIASHMYQIDHNQKTKKYIFLRQLRQEGYTIQFDVLQYIDGGDDELGQQEAIMINSRKPVLNLQLPALDNYKSWSYNLISKELNYEQLKKYCEQGSVN